jgi:uncharacterized BrkB/YihY/UPF0761 family membrane protein
MTDADIRSTIERRQRQLEEMRYRAPAAEKAFRFKDRSTGVGANLMAGAIAYRLFIWLLPASLVVVSLAGFFRDSTFYDPESAARSLGLSAYVAADVAEQSHRGRWGSLVIGLFALFFASASAGRTLHTIHQLTWGIDPKNWHRRGSHRLAGNFLVFASGVLVGSVLASWVRHKTFGPGLLATLITGVAFGAVWFWMSLRLPHADAPWRALIPGAVLVAAGTEFLHFFAAYYLVRKLASSSELYGALGSAAAILLWLYMIGLMLVASPVLNATLWHSRGEPTVTRAV